MEKLKREEKIKRKSGFLITILCLFFCILGVYAGIKYNASEIEFKSKNASFRSLVSIIELKNVTDTITLNASFVEGANFSLYKI